MNNDFFHLESAGKSPKAQPTPSWNDIQAPPESNLPPYRQAFYNNHFDKMLIREKVFKHLTPPLAIEIFTVPEIITTIQRQVLNMNPATPQQLKLNKIYSLISQGLQSFQSKQAKKIFEDNKINLYFIFDRELGIPTAPECQEIALVTGNHVFFNEQGMSILLIVLPSLIFINKILSKLIWRKNTYLYSTINKHLEQRNKLNQVIIPNLNNTTPHPTITAPSPSPTPSPAPAYQPLIYDDSPHSPSTSTIPTTSTPTYQLPIHTPPPTDYLSSPVPLKQIYLRGDEIVLVLSEIPFTMGKLIRQDIEITQHIDQKSMLYLLNNIPRPYQPPRRQ